MNQTNKPLTLRQIAKILGKSPSLLHWYAKQGRLPHIIIDGKMFYEADVIKNWKPDKRKLGRPKEHGI